MHDGRWIIFSKISSAKFDLPNLNNVRCFCTKTIGIDKHEVHIKDKDNHKHFLDRLGEQLGFKFLEDWYNVRQEDFNRSGGGELLKYYNNGCYKVLQNVYPEHKWMLWRFTQGSHKLPIGYWEKKENQKYFFDWLGIKLGYNHLHDWYNVTTESIQKHGGTGVLQYYGGSPSKALQGVYSEHNWMLWRFNTPVGYWKKLLSDSAEQKRVIEWLGQQLSIKSLEDWYRVSLAQVRKWVQVESWKTLVQMLETVHPEHKWDSSKLNTMGRSMKASQRELALVVRQLFPRQGIEEDFKHPEMVHASGVPIELDVYIEELKLAFEYQGEHHYVPAHWMSNFETQKSRDSEKQNACKQVARLLRRCNLTQHGVTLIEVPYWWDFSLETLAATVSKARPELIPDPPGADPIPEIPPNSQLTTLSHGMSWDGIQDVTGWWMSEKMDGVRAYWDGNKLISRQAKEINAPPWFTEGLPMDIQLDGELWMGRETNSQNVMAVLKAKNSDWKAIGYYVFDIPHVDITFEERLRQLERLKRRLPGHVHVVESVECTGGEHLEHYFHSIVKSKGEGVMLRQRDSKYVQGYTGTLLKVKVSLVYIRFKQEQQYEDTEVRILEILNTGLYCQQEGGQKCIVQCFPETLSSPPPVGSLITVKYSGCYSTGTLKKPLFWRLKEDAARIDFHSTEKEHMDPKEFFDHLAQEYNIQQPSDWYKLKKEDISKHGGQKLLEHYYNNSLYKGLVDRFPNLDVVPWMFEEEGVPRGYWKKPDNHRGFFDWLKRQLGYETMEDWYNVAQTVIHKHGGKGLLSKYYGGSPSQALQTVYPEHEWILEKFKTVPLGYWK